METTTHTNGHTKKAAQHAVDSATKSVKKAVRNAKKKTASVAHTIDRSATKIIDEKKGGLSTMATNTVAWVKENPKTATAVFVGTGVLVGVLAGTKFGRGALLGLTGIAVATVRRFV